MFDPIYDACRPYTIVSRDRCDTLYTLSQWAAALPGGDIAEVGTLAGGTAMLLKRANPLKAVHCFDTFQGIPNADAAIDGHANGDFADVRAGTIERLRGEGLIVHPGVFPDTAAAVADRRFCFAHFDGDTYQSCRDFCAFFDGRAVDGAILVFDDWRWHRCPGVERAVTEYCERTGHSPFPTATYQAAIVLHRR